MVKQANIEITPEFSRALKSMEAPEGHCPITGAVNVADQAIHSFFKPHCFFIHSLL